MGVCPYYFPINIYPILKNIYIKFTLHNKGKINKSPSLLVFNILLICLKMQNLFLFLVLVKQNRPVVFREKIVLPLLLKALQHGGIVGNNLLWR